MYKCRSTCAFPTKWQKGQSSQQQRPSKVDSLSGNAGTTGVCSSQWDLQWLASQCWLSAASFFASFSTGSDDLCPSNWIWSHVKHTVGFEFDGLPVTAGFLRHLENPIQHQNHRNPILRSCSHRLEDFRNSHYPPPGAGQPYMQDNLDAELLTFSAAKLQ